MTSISVDNTNSELTRTGVYGMSFAFPPRYSARYLQDPLTRYSLRSSLFGGPLIFQQVFTSLDPDTIKLTTELINEFKHYRSLIRDAIVYHIKPPNPYPGFDWDAIQAVSSNHLKSLIYVYRSNLGASSYTVIPKGLLPQNTYKVTQLDSGVSFERSGKNLMAGGIPVTLPQFSSEAIDIQSL